MNCRSGSRVMGSSMALLPRTSALLSTPQYSFHAVLRTLSERFLSSFCDPSKFTIILLTWGLCDNEEPVQEPLSERNQLLTTHPRCG